MNVSIGDVFISTRKNRSTCFHKSIILIIEKTAYSIKGFVINRPIEDKVQSIFNSIESNRNIHLGGDDKYPLSLLNEKEGIKLTESLYLLKDKNKILSFLKSNNNYKLISNVSNWTILEFRTELELGRWYKTEMLNNELFLNSTEAGIDSWDKLNEKFQLDFWKSFIKNLKKAGV